MRSAELQDLALLDADAAVRRHLDTLNYRRGRLLWWIFLFISVGALAETIEMESWLRATAAAVSLFGLLALIPTRRLESFERNFSTLLLALLSLEILLWILMPIPEGPAIAAGTVLAPLSLLLLRLRGIEELGVVGVAIGAAVLRVLAMPSAAGTAALSVGGLVGIAVAVTLGAAIGWSLTTRARQEFVLLWRQAASRERERLRMREELQDARAVQLAMLPTAAPEIPGLELAAVCVPATEVGGDYYGFFPAHDGSLSIAVGDVAGHGMASGLVLAGVRAGLQLLADEVANSPARVLERLNTVVGGIGTQRLLMTLGLGRFDRAAGHVSWVAAGHPPPLRYEAATRSWEAPETSHPPLGTRLPVNLEVIERPLAEGDVWLLVSDGAIEARDARLREFGDGHLAKIFARLAANESSAGAILDALLAELSRFRSGHPQEDDLTLVVVRATELA